jgi:glycine/D-amino acid oxidase-like deaminating enzyme
LELFEKLGVGNQYQWQSETKVQASIHSPRFRGGVFEAQSGILNPFKHVRALKRIAEQFGAEIYEHTPVVRIERRPDCIRLHTNTGILSCKKLVIAANAWSGEIRGLPRIRNRQAPVWTSQVVTEPLSDEQWDDIGWKERQSVEDNRQLLHYFRRTACGRFTIGGGNVAFPRQHKLQTLHPKQTWQDLQNHVRWLFPALKSVAFSHQWGGPVSVNLDLTPEIGFIGDKRVIYASGCIGHGVSLTQLNGRTIADLLLEKPTGLSDIWFVNRKALPWPPGWLGGGIARMIAGGLKLWDRYEERELKK